MIRNICSCNHVHLAGRYRPMPPITLLTAQAKTAESAFLRQKGEIDEKRRPPSRTNLRWPRISKLRLAAVSAIGAFAQV